MPLPQKYRKPVDDLFADRITGKELQEMIEWIDSAQMGFEFKKTNILNRLTLLRRYEDINGKDEL